jgi:predicted transposase/invertase (TIGR01784 family)
MAETREEFIVPELLPPKEDGVFKSLLTRPEAKPVLMDIISSILRLPVTDVEVRNTELPIFDIGSKRTRLDVNCVINGSRQANVEMQAEAMGGDSAAAGHRNIKNRAIHYLCDLHASQEGRGVDYAELMHSYQITFCGYRVFPGKPGFIGRYSFRDETGDELSDAVGIVFVELPKLNAVMKKPVEKMTAAEMWGIFFGHADEPKWRDLMDKMILAKGEIKMASELLSSISKDEAERARYLSRRRFLMDMEHDRTVARKEGLNEGLKEGRREGLDEGRRDFAKKLLKRNRPVGEIVEDTGLSREKIEALRAEIGN